MLEISEIGFFLLLLGTADGSLVRLLKTDLSMTSKDYILRAYKSDLFDLPSRGGKDTVIACLALKDWITGLPTIQIEKKYGLCCGSLHEVARQVSRLIRACRDIAGKVQGVFESKIQITVNVRDSAGKYQIPDGLDDAGRNGYLWSSAGSITNRLFTGRGLNPRLDNESYACS